IEGPGGDPDRPELCRHRRAARGPAAAFRTDRARRNALGLTLKKQRRPDFSERRVRSVPASLCERRGPTTGYTSKERARTRWAPRKPHDLEKSRDSVAWRLRKTRRVPRNVTRSYRCSSKNRTIARFRKASDSTPRN